MKKLILALIIGTSLLNYSCKKDEVEVAHQPDKPALVGTFEVPDKKDVTFEMSNTDGFATVVVNHEGNVFTFNNKYRMKEVNLIITSGKYYVRLKTYAKDNDTYVSYFLADTKESNVIYGYVGSVKRIK